MYYLERNTIPGICVESVNKTTSRSLMKLSESRVRAAAESDTSGGDVSVDECFSLDYRS